MFPNIKAFNEEMQKLAYEEVMLDAFHEETQKLAGINMISGIGGALRAGAGRGSQLFSKGLGEGGLRGAFQSVGKAMSGGYQGAHTLAGRGIGSHMTNTAKKNLGVGLGALGAAGLGAYGLTR